MLIKSNSIFSKKNTSEKNTSEDNIVIQKSSSSSNDAKHNIRNTNSNANTSFNQTSNISSSMQSPNSASKVPSIPREQFHIEASKNDDDENNEDNRPSSCFGNCWGNFLLLFQKK